MRLTPDGFRVAAALRWCTVGLLVLGTLPATAVILNPRIEHRYRHTVSEPFATDDDRDFTSTFGTYLREFVVGLPSNQASAEQNITISPTFYDATLITTLTGDSGFATSSADFEFELDAPARLIISGTGNGAASDNGNPFVSGGGAGLSLTRLGFPNENLFSLFATTNGVPWSQAGPVDLEAGRYFLGASANISSGATGTITNRVQVTFMGSAGQPGDYNGNGSVEQGDLDLVLTDWGNARSGWGEGAGFATAQVDQEELDAVLGNWGSGAAPGFASSPSAVPEPSLMAAAGLSLGLLGRRRRWRCL